MNILRFSFFLSILCSHWVVAQQGYSIKGKLKDVNQSKPIYLVYYYGNQFLLADTAKFDADGQSFRFENKTKKLDGGQYFLGFDKVKSFDFLIDQSQHFSFEADTADIQNTIRFKDSKENEYFFEYSKMIQEKRKEVEDFRIEKNLATDDYKNPDFVAKVKQVQADLDALVSKFIKKHKNEFVGKLVKSYREPDLPEFKTPEGRIDSVKLYYYHKSHYFDNLDLQDERMLRTPMVMSRVDNFFKSMILAISKDSVIAEIDKLMARTSGKLMRKNIILTIAKKYEMPSMLGLDGTYPHILNKYYINEPALWDSSSVVQAKKVFNVQDPIIIGKIIPDMMLADTLGNALPLSGIKAKYTMLYIFNPDCGACKATTPKLPAFYEKMKAKYDFKLLTASIAHDEKRWREFIKEYKIEGLINGMDPYGIVNFENYNNYNFPNIYILDQDKRIVAKHLGLDQVEGIIASREEEEIRIKKMAEKTKE